MPDSSDATIPRQATGGVYPWSIAVLVAVVTFIQVLDTTIANVVLLYISGDGML